MPVPGDRPSPAAPAPTTSATVHAPASAEAHAEASAATSAASQVTTAPPQPSATVVITSAVPWGGVTARPHHIARGLARRGWNVLFVDAPVTLLSPLKNRESAARLLPRPPVTRVLEGRDTGWLRVLSPPAVLPFANVCRPVNRVNQRLLASLIRQAAPGPYVLLATLPGSVDLVPALAPVATVYDCVDFHSEFPGFVSPPVVDRMEADLAGVSRVVFTTARRLQERMEQLHTDVRLIPNAAETEHFQAALSAEPHEELGAIPRPRVAMVGGVGPWIDQRWLAELADRLPGVQFVLIGPVETDVTALRQRANVHLLGRRPYNRLPRYLAGCQAALVPFRTDDPVAMAVNPIKVYEYLAAGREVVATPIPELLQMDDLLWLAPDAETAAEALRRILDGERRAPDERIQTFVAANSWDARVQAVDEALRSVVPLALRPAGPA